MFKRTMLTLTVLAVFVAITFTGCGDSAVTSTPVSSTATPAAELTPAEKNAEIALHYNERPPYLTLKGNDVEGLTASPAAAAFRKAGIPFYWQETPSNRQLAILQDTPGQDCLVGWFKNPEREKFAKYTLPVYQDEPQIALTWANNPQLKSGDAVSATLSNPDIVLLVKDGYSYGKFLDDKIAELSPNQESTTGENADMVKLIYNKRADFFFIAPEEVEGVIAATEYSMDDFSMITFSDMPEGEKRYILCSMAVDDSVIEKLNSAIGQ